MVNNQLQKYFFLFTCTFILNYIVHMLSLLQKVHWTITTIHAFFGTNTFFYDER